MSAAAPMKGVEGEDADAGARAAAAETVLGLVGAASLGAARRMRNPARAGDALRAD